VYAGSIFSALLGLVILAKALPMQAARSNENTDDPTRPFILAEPEYEVYEKAKP
jgi:hypothetical protein